MVKRREPLQPKAPHDVERRIEAFAAGADDLGAVSPLVNKDAARDYKAIRVPFNQYEYEVLEKLCQQTNRSKLNMIRHALLTYAQRDATE